MDIILVVLGFAALILGFVCSIIILIEAFKDEIWKGIASLLCGFYFLWYSLMEFEHDNKWLIVLGALGGGSIAAGLFRATGYV